MGSFQDKWTDTFQSRVLNLKVCKCCGARCVWKHHSTDFSHLCMGARYAASFALSWRAAKRAKQRFCRTLFHKNHTMVKFGRDFRRSSCLTPMLKQGHLEPAAQDPTHYTNKYIGTTQCCKLLLILSWLHKGSWPAVFTFLHV